MITTLYYIGGMFILYVVKLSLKSLKSSMILIYSSCVKYVYHTYYSVKDNKILVKCLFYINIDTDGDITQQT